MTAEAERGSKRTLHFMGLSFTLAAFYLLFAGEWEITECIAGIVAVFSALGMRALETRVGSVIHLYWHPCSQLLSVSISA
jgi:multisubunit Na+/H+ antiporter MnhE subunit